MHTAFDVETVLERFPLAIECLEAQQDALLAGTKDGTLLVIGRELHLDGPREPQGEEGPPPTRPLPSGPWRLLEAHKQFSRRPILQLKSFEDSSGLVHLVVLTEEGAAFHRRSAGSRTAYELGHPAPGKTRGANCMAWDDEHQILAVAVKRRLFLFHHSPSRCTELKEIGLQDVARSLAWAGEGAICVALRREYILVNTTTCAASELFPAGNVPHPQALSVPTGELLINKDGVGIFINQQGKPTRKMAMAWSEPPTHLVLSVPYALAVMQTKQLVEVRSVERGSHHELVQIAPVPGDVKALAVDPRGCVFIASGNTSGSVRCLIPVPLLEQISELAAQEDFEGALNLCHLLSEKGEETVAKRHALEDDLHLRFGESLFRQKEFEEALAHLGMVRRPSPAHLLQLFPSLAPQVPATRQRVAKLLEAGALGAEQLIRGQPPPDLSPEERQLVMSNVLPYLMSYRGRLANKDTSAADTRAEESAQEDPGAPGEPQAHAPEHSLMVMLVDTAIMKAMLGMNDTGALLGFIQRSNSVDLAEGENALKAEGRYAELVALYEGNGCHREALELLSTLSQDPSSLTVPAKGAASELVGLPGVWAAVRYCARLGRGGQRASLVLDFSQWILTADPENGIEMFMEMDPPLSPSKVLSHLRSTIPSMCIPYLEAALERGIATPAEHHSELVLLYLQDALQGADGPQASAEVVGAGKREGGGSSSSKRSQGADRALMGSSREHRLERLRQLVSSSPHIDLERILYWLPKGAMLNARAILLQRLGRTREVLDLFVNQVGNAALAEEYCDFIFDYYAALRRGAALSSPCSPARSGDMTLCPPDELREGGSRGAAGGGDEEHQSSGSDRAQQPDIYLHLLQVMLGASKQPRSSPGGEAADRRVMTRVAKLLSRKQHRINPMVALTLLPDDVPLADVASFLEGAIRGMGEERHNTAIVKSLRRGENLQVREELVRCRQRRVVVSNERACILCHKRIGGSVFAAYPDNSLVHFACYKRTVASASVPVNLR